MNVSVSTTIISWGALVTTSGVAWLVAPNQFQAKLLQTGLFNADDVEPHNAWTKMFACTAIVLGGYYISAGLEDDVAFARRTVFGRPIIFLLMVLSKVPKSMFLFGASDCIGAFWTWNALRKREHRRKS